MSEEVSAFSAYQNVLANKKVEVPKKKKKKSKVSLSDLYLQYVHKILLIKCNFIYWVMPYILPPKNLKGLCQGREFVSCV